MEIKIQCDNGETYLFEGKNLFHKFINYESRKDFQDKYTEHTKNISGHVIGLPEYCWNNKDKEHENMSGFFLRIYFGDKKDELNFLIVKDSTIFVTNKGYTIDKVLC